MAVAILVEASRAIKVHGAAAVCTGSSCSDISSSNGVDCCLHNECVVWTKW